MKYGDRNRLTNRKFKFETETCRRPEGCFSCLPLVRIILYSCHQGSPHLATEPGLSETVTPTIPGWMLVLPSSAHALASGRRAGRALQRFDVFGIVSPK